MEQTNGWKVRVRMYRQGLGDSFLITLRTDGQERHALIDCGVLKSTPGASELMRQVVTNIRETASDKLELLVGTHEHWDHLSAFGESQAQDLWDQIQISNIWLGWTEDPADAQAEALHQRFENMKLALQMTMDASAMKDSRAIVVPLLQFFGYDGQPSPFQFAQSTRDALNYIHGRKQTSDLAFCQPGQVKIVSSMPGLRFYILGPPRDEKFLMKDLPRKGKNETYEFALAGSIGQYFLDAPHLDRLRDAYPFSPKFHIKKDANAIQAFLKRTGYDPDDWRGINPEVTASATELALQMDSDTNNTSLAMAIEIVETGQVLLFPGDAQVGNWQSWHTVKFEGHESLTVQSLLERTVFYKVGHHGSHNATLREGGLELMTHPDLVAMLPTNEALALNQGKKGWEMPAKALHIALTDKTRGRIIRADTGAPLERPEALSQADWMKFRGCVGDTESLWADYRI